MQTLNRKPFAQSNPEHYSHDATLLHLIFSMISIATHGVWQEPKIVVFRAANTDTNRSADPRRTLKSFKHVQYCSSLLWMLCLQVLTSAAWWTWSPCIGAWSRASTTPGWGECADRAWRGRITSRCCWAWMTQWSSFTRRRTSRSTCSHSWTS